MTFIKDVSARLYAAAMSRPRSNRVPYAGVVFDESEVRNAIGALYDAFVSGWFAIGKNGAEFEDIFCKYLGLKYCVLTNSGSSANLLAIGGMIHLKRLRTGEEVITPATTFPTTVNPLLLYGLKPVLIDVDLPSYTISAETLRKAASSETRGVMLPHLNGSASYMPEIIELAEKKDWIIIEDCCDALGTSIDDKYAGTFGHASTFSFYGAHHICMGEGGAILSNDKEFVDVVRSLRDWGRALGNGVFDMKKGRKIERVGKGSSLPEDYESRFTYVTKGFNLKPIDLQPAIGLAQLRKLDDFCEARKRNYRILFKALSKYKRLLILPEAAKGVDPSWFVFPIVVKDSAGFTRKELVDYLESKGIETRPILAGNAFRQPAYADVDFRVVGNLVNSDLILRGGFFVGVYPGLSQKHLKTIINAFDSFLSQRILGNKSRHVSSS